MIGVDTVSVAFAVETELDSCELLAPGVAYQSSKNTLFALQELEVSEKDRQALRLGQTHPFSHRFALAAELLPQLEDRGIVGPNKGAEPRDILLDLDGEGYDGGGQQMV